MAKKKPVVNILKFRVIIDAEEDVFRDIEIETDNTFEEFHKAILDAFDFDEGEMASFYLSNENWEKGMEIPLMQMASKAEGGSAMIMKNTKLGDVVSNPSDKILYVYDFLRMWCFYIELVEVKKDKPSTIYPRVALVFGEAPSQDSKEMDLFGEEYSKEEFDEFNEADADGDEEDDEFGFGKSEFDEDEFSGNTSDREDY